jgi:hypothetical protein
VRLNEDDIQRLLGENFDSEACGKILDLLLWYGVLVVVRPTDEVAIIYSVNYDMKHLKANLQNVPDHKRWLFVNPAFWPGLEVTEQHRLL